MNSFQFATYLHGFVLLSPYTLSRHYITLDVPVSSADFWNSPHTLGNPQLEMLGTRG